MIVFSFYRNFHERKIFWAIAATNFCTTIQSALLQPSWFNLHDFFRLFYQSPIIKLPLLIRKQKITCENCGTHNTRNKIVWHRKKWSARKHKTPKPVVTFKCKLSYREFPGFYALRQHKNTTQGFSIWTANVDPHDVISDVEGMNLNEELHSCQLFLVMDGGFWPWKGETQSIQLHSGKS